MKLSQVFFTSSGLATCIPPSRKNRISDITALSLLLRGGIFTICCLFVKSHLLLAQDNRAFRYILNSETDNLRRIYWDVYNGGNLSLAVDTSVIIDTQKPVQKIVIAGNKRAALGKSKKKHIISSGLLLKPSDADSITVRLSYKSENLSNPVFITQCMDDEGDVISSDTTILLKDTGWTIAKAIHPLRNVRFLRFEFQLQSDNVKGNSALFLDDIQLSMNKDQLYSSISDADSHYKIKKKKLKDLDVSEEKRYGPISELRTKKIVALGESVHGSQTIEKAAIDILKYRVTHGNCKLILIELPLDEMLSVNQYVRGNEAFHLDSIVKYGVISQSVYSKNMLGFFEWVKEYNKTADKKVRVLGFDVNIEDLPVYNLNLFDYLRKTNKLEAEDEICKRLAAITFYHNDVVKALKEVEAEKKIRLDPTELNMIGHYHQQLYRLHSSDNKFIIRDSIMYENIRYLTGLLCAPDETVTFYGHLGHICNNRFRASWSFNDQSCGGLLKNLFKNDFFSIGFFVGNGENTTINNFNFMVNELPCPYSLSLESKLNISNHRYFFTNSASLPKGPLYMRVGTISANNRFFIGYPHLLMDGIVYLSQSKPSDVIRPEVSFGEKAVPKMLQLRQYLKLLPGNYNIFNH